MNDKYPDHFYRLSIKALILDGNGRFLLAKEKSGTWEFPGGALEFGEVPHACIKRELDEEMGVQVTHIDPHPSYFLTDKHSSGCWLANIFYVTTVKDLNFVPSDECIEVRFFSTAIGHTRAARPIFGPRAVQRGPQGQRDPLSGTSL